MRKPGASPLLFGKFQMNTTAFLSLEDIRNTMQARCGIKSLMNNLLNMLLLNPDYPHNFKEIWREPSIPMKEHEK